MLTKLITIIRKCIVILRVRLIRSRDISIIASNCAGVLPYRFLGGPYCSPTVNLYFFAEDYLEFVRHLDHYLSLPLTFIANSRYPQAETTRANHGHYPVGRLGDIEIHFMHYQSETEAQDKWNRRKARINRDKMVLVFTDQNLCTEQLLAEFDALPYKNKIAFTARKYPHLRSSVYLPKYAGRSEIGDVFTHYDALSHLDLAALYDRHDSATVPPGSGTEKTPSARLPHSPSAPTALLVHCNKTADLSPSQQHQSGR